MVRARHFRYLIAIAVTATGCGYAGDRLRDFGDMFRVEITGGIGAQAGVNLGEMLHFGAGSSRRYAIGWNYGVANTEHRVEDQFPLSYVWTLTSGGEKELLHELEFGDGKTSQFHRCDMIFPGELHPGATVQRPNALYWNIEVSAFAGIVGVDAGFSLGEFVDFIGGLFTLDPAFDDGDLRASRKLWVPAPANRSPKW